MKLLFVHEKFGALAGAESNILATARELKMRGHSVAILHGPSTGKAEAAWQETFDPRFELGPDIITQIPAVLDRFQADAIYIHKLADLEALEALEGLFTRLSTRLSSQTQCFITA